MIEVPEMEMEFPDGSTYELSENQRKAILMKTDDPVEVLRACIKKTEKHWHQQTVPTKFHFHDEDWEEGEYEDMAELSEDVLYYKYTRAPQMALAMAQITDDDEDAPSVVGIGEDGEVTEYDGDEEIAVTREPEEEE